MAGSVEINEIDGGDPNHDIAAASVIAGDEAASVNIPYMTPPVGSVENPLNMQLRQGHYSGDSHDSSSENIQIVFLNIFYKIIIFQKDIRVSVFENHYRELWPVLGIEMYCQTLIMLLFQTILV